METNDEEEMKFITQHLEKQDETLREILLVIKGNVSYGVTGLIAQLKELKEAQALLISDMAHLQRFKKRLEDDRGKVIFSWKTVFAIIGAIAAAAGALLAFKQLLET